MIKIVVIRGAFWWSLKGGLCFSGGHISRQNLTVTSSFRGKAPILS